MRWKPLAAVAAVLAIICFVVWFSAHSVLDEIRLTRQTLEAQRTSLRWTGDINSPIQVWTRTKNLQTLTTTVTQGSTGFQVTVTTTRDEGETTEHFVRRHEETCTWIIEH